MALREWQGRRSTWSSGHGAELQLSLVQHTAQCWHNICTSARAFSQISAEVGDAQTSGSAPSTARFHQWAFGSLSGGTEVPLLPLPATFFQVGHASLLAQPLLQPDPTAIPPLAAALLDCTMLVCLPSILPLPFVLLHHPADSLLPSQTTLPGLLCSRKSLPGSLCLVPATSNPVFQAMPLTFLPFYGSQGRWSHLLALWMQR